MRYFLLFRYYYICYVIYDQGSLTLLLQKDYDLRIAQVTALAIVCFMSALGRCCWGPFPGCVEWGRLFTAVRRRALGP